MKDTSTAPPAKAPTSNGFAATRPIGATTRGAKLPVFGERTRPFMFAFHYSSWELVQTSKGWRLVPTLKRLVLKAGVNWTPASKKGAPLDASHLEAKARSRWDVTILTAMDEYLVEVDGEGAPGIFLKWERVKTYNDGKFSIDMDNDGYDLWRWSLVVDGRVEGPRDDILADLRRRLRKQQDRATRTPHLAQAQRAEAEAKTRIDGLDEALKALKAAQSPPAAAAAK